MKTTLMLLAACVGCLLAGCASPQGGTAEPAEKPISGKSEGVAPKPMAAPMPPALSGQNLRDMRSPQSVTIPGPPVAPQPVAPQPAPQP